MTIHRQIILFVKPPFVGTVKTRLAWEVGKDRALALYKAMVLDMLAVLDKTGIGLQIHVAPQGDSGKSLQACKQWLGEKRHYVLQHGEHLGERIINAFGAAFQGGAAQVVLLGSDIPVICKKDITRAFQNLDHYPLTLAPSDDGGYSLVGFGEQTFFPPIFQNIPWSTSEVLSCTLHILKEYKKKPALLPELADIDTLSDLEALAKNYEDKPQKGPCHTLRVFEKYLMAKEG